MKKDRFFTLSQNMYQAFQSGDMPKAEKLAQDYLSLAESSQSNWNYGNAIHQSYLLLGRIELKKGEIKAAKAYLLKAGKTPGSPQLNSFGPNMMLAKELLELGEKEVVLQYIDLTKQFWKWMFSWRKTKRWKKQILQGRIPDFGANLEYKV